MKKILLLISILLTVIGTYAATYKINSAGKISSPSGSPTQSAKTKTVQSPYSNYSSSSYVRNNTLNSTPTGTIEIVMDFSGSMTDWVNVAKQTMSGILSQIPQNTLVGFRVFGQGGDITSKPLTARVTGVSQGKSKNGVSTYKVNTEQISKGSSFMGCSATKQVAPVVSLNVQNLLTGMNSVELGGSTPLVLALQQTVYADFGSLGQNSAKKIILITDGGENCGGDPCAFAKQLMAQRNDIHIDVVLVSSNSRHLKCLASTTGGRFYNVNSYYDFATTVTQSMTNNTTNNTVQTNSKQQTQEPIQNYEFIDDEEY